MHRLPEPELMDLPAEVEAYASADFADVNGRFIARALELAEPDATLHVIDLGCGPGDMAIAIARQRPHWQVLGIDASVPMLTIARHRAGGGGASGNVSFRQADVKALPDDLGRFDLFLSNSLLHHLPDPAGFWRSVQQLARTGSRLFLRDLSRPPSEADAARLVATYAGGESALLQEEYHRSLRAAFTPDEVRAQLRQAGLRGLEVAMSSDRHLDVWGAIGLD